MKFKGDFIPSTPPVLDRFRDIGQLFGSKQDVCARK